MSQTDKLLSNIREYQNLLGYLSDRYPNVLKEWSNGLRAATTNRHQSQNQPTEVIDLNT